MCQIYINIKGSVSSRHRNSNVSRKVIVILLNPSKPKKEKTKQIFESDKNCKKCMILLEHETLHQDLVIRRTAKYTMAIWNLFVSILFLSGRFVVYFAKTLQVVFFSCSTSSYGLVISQYRDSLNYQ
nr:very hypothetical protein SPAC3F10.14 - fission yeast (Schizosaccharomyces pombe) [Schizosaccharomyces pombe]